MQESGFATLGLLLFVASLVAMITRRLKLPYSVGLVVAGVGLALLPSGYAPVLTKELVFTVFLPPLIFEAAIQIPWAPFRRELPLLAALVTVGVLLAAAVVAAGMHWLVGWGWLASWFLGIMLAATDPVAVIALFKTIPVARRLHLLVEAESLLNDGVAAVVFVVLLLIASGSHTTAGAVAGTLLLTSVGGVACGAIVTGALLLIAGRTDDNLVEVTLTTLAAFGSFLVAEHFGASGVLAALTGGIMVGNVGWMGSISDSGRPSVLNFWEYAAFLANSLIFILIGSSIASISLLPVLAASAVAIVLALVGRAATVYPIAALFRRSALAVSSAYQHVLWWGGLRGALALALALALPSTLPERHDMIAVTFAVVAFSIIVQGITMSGLIRRLGLMRSEEAGE